MEPSSVERQVSLATVLLTLPAAADAIATVSWAAQGTLGFERGPTLLQVGTIVFRTLSVLFTPFIVLALIVWTLAWGRDRPWWLPAAAAFNLTVLAYQAWWLFGR